MNHYAYRAEWSPEQGEYVGRCIELPWLSRWAPTMREAIAAIEQAADEFIAERQEAGEEVPRPLTERQDCRRGDDAGQPSPPSRVLMG
jgi:predicted RNase H-like HicB family nuclease